MKRKELTQNNTRSISFTTLGGEQQLPVSLVEESIEKEILQKNKMTMMTQEKKILEKNKPNLNLVV